MPSRYSESQPRRPGRPVGGQSGAGRVALLRAARELMAEEGLPRLTSKAVAKRAGVKPTLINYYFGDRTGLLHAVVAEISAESAERLQAASRYEGTVEERLVHLMDGLLRGFAGEPYVPRLLFEQVIFASDDVIDQFIERFGRSHFDAIRSVLEDGRHQGLFRGVDLEIALAAIGGICVFFGAATPFLHRLMNFGEISPDNVASIAERAAELILHGLRSPERNS